MYFVIDTFSANTSKNNGSSSSSSFGEDAAHLRGHFQLPGNIILPSWLPLDPRM